MSLKNQISSQDNNSQNYDALDATVGQVVDGLNQTMVAVENNVADLDKQINEQIDKICQDMYLKYANDKGVLDQKSFRDVYKDIFTTITIPGYQVDFDPKRIDSLYEFVKNIKFKIEDEKKRLEQIIVLKEKELIETKDQKLKNIMKSQINALKEQLNSDMTKQKDGIQQPQLNQWMKDIKNNIGSESRSIIKWGIIGYVAGGISGILCNIF